MRAMFPAVIQAAQQSVHSWKRDILLQMCRPSLWTVALQVLLPPFFLSVTSSICLCLLSRTSIRLALFRSRSWALSSSTSSKNLCLHPCARFTIKNITTLQRHGVWRLLSISALKAKLNEKLSLGDPSLVLRMCFLLRDITDKYGKHSQTLIS